MNTSLRESVVAGATAALAIAGWFSTYLLEYANPTKVFFSGIYLAIGIGYGLATLKGSKFKTADAIVSAGILAGGAFFLVPTLSEAVAVRQRNDLACLVIEDQLFDLHPVKDNAAEAFSALKCRLESDRDYLAAMKARTKELNEEIGSKEQLLKRLPQR